jgi:hypothetical protein
MGQVFLGGAVHDLDHAGSSSLEAFECDRVPCLDRRYEVVGTDQQLGGLAHEALADAGAGVALERLDLKAGETLASPVRFVEQDECLRRQEVEELLELGLEQGCDGFRAGRKRATQQRVEQPIDIAPGHALGVAEAADGVGSFDHQLAGGEDLARRRRHQLLEIGLGALAGGVEIPDGFDLVAEQLDPHRMTALRREQVDDAAAHRDFAALLDHRLARVARTDQPGDECVAVDRLAEGNAECRVCDGAA